MSGSRPGQGLLVLTEDSKPLLGGIAESLHNFSSTVAQRAPVRILSSVDGADDYGAEPNLSYQVVPWFRAQHTMRGDAFPVVRKLNTLRWLAGRPARVRRLLDREWRQIRPALLLVYRVSPVTHPWMRAARELGLPYDVVVYGLELVESLSRRAAAARRTDLLSARRVWSISRATTEVVRGLGVPANRIEAFPQGIAPERLPEPTAEDRRELRRQLGLDAAPFILSLCTLVQRKGIDIALHAFADVSRTHHDLRYVIAGEGPEAAALEAQARSLGVAPRVHFPGPVTDAMKQALMAECELFVMPNRRLAHDMEGFGIVFLEAGWYGKAVIGGNNGGVPDAVEHGVTGLLVDTASGPGPTREAMERLLADREERERMGRAGRRRACALTWTRVADAFLARALGSATPSREAATATVRYAEMI